MINSGSTSINVNKDLCLCRHDHESKVYSDLLTLIYFQACHGKQYFFCGIGLSLFTNRLMLIAGEAGYVGSHVQSPEDSDVRQYSACRALSGKPDSLILKSFIK